MVELLARNSVINGSAPAGRRPATNPQITPPARQANDGRVKGTRNDISLRTTRERLRLHASEMKIAWRRKGAEGNTLRARGGVDPGSLTSLSSLGESAETLNRERRQVRTCVGEKGAEGEGPCN